MRKVGYEIECYIPQGYADEIAEHSMVKILKEDYSLGYLEGHYALEINTIPTTYISNIGNLYKYLQERDVNTDDHCGLHVHVDIADYTMLDFVKLLRLGAGIELLMYAMVEPERYEIGEAPNQYCVKLYHGWRKTANVFNDIPADIGEKVVSPRNYERLCDWLNDHTRYHNYWNGRYQWLNCMTGHGTAEFRIFDATMLPIRAMKYGMIARAIVDYAKQTTMEEIMALISNIYQQSLSVSEMYSKLFGAIGLDNLQLELYNESLVQYLDNRYCERNRSYQQNQTAAM